MSHCPAPPISPGEDPIATGFDDDPWELLKKALAAQVIIRTLRLPVEVHSSCRRRWRVALDWLQLCVWSLRQMLERRPDQADALFPLAESSFTNADAIAIELNTPSRLPSSASVKQSVQSSIFLGY